MRSTTTGYLLHTLYVLRTVKLRHPGVTYTPCNLQCGWDVPYLSGRAKIHVFTIYANYAERFQVIVYSG